MKFKEHLSASKISKYEQCPHRFWLEVIEKCVKVESGNMMALHVGSLFHKAMELLVDTNDGDIFEMASNGVDFNPTKEEVSMAKEIFSRYNGDDYARNRFFDPIGTEHEIDSDIDGIYFKGAIDRLDQIDKDTIGIIDYKTNRSVYPLSDIENNPQVIIYAYYIWEKFMEKKDGTIVFIFDFVKFRKGEIKVVINIGVEPTKFGAINWDKDTFLAKWDYIKSIYKQILQDETHKPSVTPLCSYCPVRNFCEKYKQIVESEHLEVENPEDIDELMALYNKASAIKSISDARRKEIGKIIVGRLEEGANPTRHDVRPQQRQSKQRPISYILEHVPKEELRRILTVSEKSLNESDIEPSILEKIEELTVVNTTASWNLYKEKKEG